MAEAWMNEFRADEARCRAAVHTALIRAHPQEAELAP